MPDQGAGEDAGHEKRNRQEIVSGDGESPLPGVQAGLGGVAAHERSVDLVVEEGIGVDIAGDEREDSGERLLRRQGRGASRSPCGVRRPAHFSSGITTSPFGILAKTLAGTPKLVASRRSGLEASQAVMEID